jgi:hypothetical protein
MLGLVVDMVYVQGITTKVCHLNVLLRTILSHALPSRPLMTLCVCVRIAFSRCFQSDDMPRVGASLC